MAAADVVAAVAIAHVEDAAPKARAPMKLKAVRKLSAGSSDPASPSPSRVTSYDDVQSSTVASDGQGSEDLPDSGSERGSSPRWSREPGSPGFTPNGCDAPVVTDVTDEDVMGLYESREASGYYGRIRTPSPVCMPSDRTIRCMPCVPLPAAPGHWDVTDSYNVANSYDVAMQPGQYGRVTTPPGGLALSSTATMRLEPGARWADAEADECDECYVPPPPSAAMVGHGEYTAQVGHCEYTGVQYPTRGSFGHPWACQEACKYHSKKKGCKDGFNCNRCHLCEWRRSAGVLSKQQLRMSAMTRRYQ